MEKIPIYRPHLHGNEKKYLNECIDSTWISSKGPFLAQFENRFREFVGSEFAISVCNGTAALHLALLGLGIKAGDEVIVPSLTYVSSVNAIAYTGADPVFADSLQSNWQIDPDDVRKKITLKTKAILAVHLYGHPCNIEALQKIADDAGIYLIEDCAEAFGAYCKNTHVGNMGVVATYSFFGNKTITTGEGGMVVCKDFNLYNKLSSLKNQGNDSIRSYWHTQIGYNYRMTNLSAAIGLAQIEQAPEILKKKRMLAHQYQDRLQGLPLQIHQENRGYTHSYWMISILLNAAKDRDPLRSYLSSCGIETRNFFYPTHCLPMYEKAASGPSCKNAIDISCRGINLPSFPDLTDLEVTFICEQITRYYHQNLLSSSDAADMLEALQPSI
ncbi:MAG TPA: DegT/DnrJ/EryC1/StrS aminotransferase family protein [Chlamydiales bacterium]|nr:DegT/DnrJ/EryC1/StrS aminotransferase family protein [Chlamydiales bacterium]